MTLIRVDFPAPFGPIIATRSPFLTDIDVSFSIYLPSLLTDACFISMIFCISPYYGAAVFVTIALSGKLFFNAFASAINNWPRIPALRAFSVKKSLHNRQFNETI